MSNLVTACPLCTQVFFPEMIGKVCNSGGTLIHLPEVSQQDLNSICHVLFCSLRNNDQHKDKSEKIYNDFLNLSEPVKSVYGDKFIIPSHFAQVLIDTPGDEVPKFYDQFLSGIRVLPDFESFRPLLDKWIL